MRMQLQISSDRFLHWKPISFKTSLYWLIISPGLRQLIGLIQHPSGRSSNHTCFTVSVIMLRYEVISGLDQHDLLHVKVRHSDPPQQPQCLCSQLLSAGFLLCLRRGWLWPGHSQHWSSSSSCFLFSIKNYISVLQANMKVHSQGCMEAVSFYMRDNITTLVGLIVATLFIQVTGDFYNFSRLGVKRIIC